MMEARAGISKKDAASMENGSPVCAVDLRCEYRANPLGIDVTVPRLSWRLHAGTSQRGIHQVAYQVHVSSSPDLLEGAKPDLWDSGKVDSDQSFQVEYAGVPLASRMRCHWQVRVWDQDGNLSGWSKPGHWTMGLLEQADWEADWMGYDAAYSLSPEQVAENDLLHIRGLSWIQMPADQGRNSLPTGFRGRVVVVDTSCLRRAVLVLYAFQRCDAWVNGQPVGSAFHWEKTARLDVTHAMQAGDNVIAVLAEHTDPHYPSVIGRLVLQFDGAADQIMPLDASWKVSQDLADGWQETVFDEDGWLLAEEVKNPWGSTPPVADVPRVPAPYLRRAFDIDQVVCRATVYVTALGTYELRLNGERVGDDVLAPGWTDFRKRVHYQTYDVTRQVRKGANVIGAILGDGWYASDLAHLARRNNYGGNPRLLVQLEIEHADGTVVKVVGDEKWRASYGPIRHADLLLGCEYDARLELTGWDTDGFDAGNWCPVITRKVESAAAAKDDGKTAASIPLLQASVADATRVIEELAAISLREPHPGRWTFDLGQNMVGWVRIRLRGVAGQRITIRHSEMLNADGSIYTAALRSCPATDYYICKGTGEELFEPLFTFHGFRYVEVSGLDEAPLVDDVTGIVVHTPMRRTGRFESSHALLNKLYSNIIWGQKGNFVEVPTDCPQRDERMGWTGDTQFFAPTALYNFDGANFYTRWVENCEDAQFPDGSMPNVVPRIWGGSGVTAWGDAALICTYLVYRAYGDTRIIGQRFAAMERYMQWLETKVDAEGITQVGGYGDWLHAGSSAPKPMMDTAYHAYLAGIMSEMAAAIGLAQEAMRYAERQAATRDSFVRHFFDADGSLREAGQTGYALAFTMDLVPGDLSGKAAGQFVESIRNHDWHLGTGFIGTPRLLPGLGKAVRDDVANRLLLTDTYPSWLFPVKNGATTMWERWDGWTPDKGFGLVNMNSFNHYAFGAVGEYLYSGIGGIRAASPGYRTVVVRPAVPLSGWEGQPGVTWANTSFEAPSGLIVSNWKLDQGRVFMEVEVPPNTTAEVHVPASDPGNVMESGKAAGMAEGVCFLRMDHGKAVFNVGSGRYTFSSTV
jgi:alpha-L-rhamnosidase